MLATRNKDGGGLMEHSVRLMLVIAASAMAPGCGEEGRRSNGESCDRSAQCASGLCSSLVCVDPGRVDAATSDVESDADRDAAALDAETPGLPDAPDGGDGSHDAPDVALPDADGGPADATTDAADAETTGPSAQICPPTPRDAILFGTHPLTVVDGTLSWPSAPVTFLPGGDDAVVVPALEQEADRLHLYVARMTAAGLAWSAQVVAESPTLLVNVIQARYAPAEDAVYVGFEASRGDRTIRFYDANGELFREFSPGGTAGSDLAGLDQTNLFIARYDATGAITWVHRFGPNDADGRRDASIENIQLVGDVLRVTGGFSGPVVFPIDPGELVLGLDQPDALTLFRADGLGYAADFDRATGEYRADSLVTLEGDGQFLTSLRGAQGQTNAAGERVIAGSHFGPEFGELSYGGATITATQPSAYVFKSSPTAGTWGRFIERVGSNARHQARGLALAEDGSVVLALYSNSSATGLVDWSLDTGGAPLIISLEPDDAVVIRYSATGAIDWTRRVDLRLTDSLPGALVLDEATDAVFLSGHASGQASFPRDDAAPFLVDPGEYVAELRLSTGAPRWVAQMSGGQLGVPRVTETAVQVPVRFSTLSFGGSPARQLQTPSGADASGEVVLDRAGQFVTCGVLVDQARGVWPTAAAAGN